jgi:hypothetical protein
MMVRQQDCTLAAACRPKVRRFWDHPVLKPVAAQRIHATGFMPLYLCMSLSQNRYALLGDMHESGVNQLIVDDATRMRVNCENRVTDGGGMGSWPVHGAAS